MITIDKASVIDVPELAVLINKAYKGVPGKSWTAESHLLEGARINEATLTGFIGDKDTVILKCMQNNEIIGSVYLKHDDKGIYMGMLSVDPDKQNTGTGKLLLKHIEWYAREQNRDRLHLTVISARHELVEWYKRHGFKPTGAVQPFPVGAGVGIQKQPLELLVMEKLI
ncbi:GNAT family N-acetyltransferase [Mucilaginibacter sp. AW1-3]